MSNYVAYPHTSIAVSLDGHCFNSKPAQNDIVGISDRLPSSKVTLPLAEIAQALVLPSGRSFCPAHFKSDASGVRSRSNECWSGQTLFALDFDGGLTLEDALARAADYRVRFAFAYTTFSASAEEKFRAVFVHSCEVTDLRVRKVVQQGLMMVFPEADASCKDPARIFFGGKALIHEDYEAVVTVDDILEAACLHIRASDKSGNGSRVLKAFSRECGLVMRNHLPKWDSPGAGQEDHVHATVRGIGCGQDGDVQTTVPIESYRSGGATVIGDIRLFFFSSNGRSSSDDDKSLSAETSTRSPIRRFDFDRLAAECRLYSGFADGSSWLYHQELYGLATNLLVIEGGKKKFLDGLLKRPEYASKPWSTYASYIVQRLYHPQRCGAYCPHAAGCTHSDLMVQQGKTPRGTIRKLGSSTPKKCAELEGELQKHFQKALRSDNNDVYVIKTPAGLGKTEQYLACTGCIIASPTHNLNGEIASRMIEAGNADVLVTPPLPVLDDDYRKEVERLYRSGAYSEAHARLARLAKEGHIECADYLTALETARTARGTVLTTHDRVLFLDPLGRTIIFDEDPTPALLPVDQVRLSDLFTLLCATKAGRAEPAVGALVGQAQAAMVNVVQEAPGYVMNDAAALQREVGASSLIQSNVIGFLACSHFVKAEVQHGQQIIQFISRRPIPQGKMIVLSATANETVCRLLYGSRLHFIDLGEAVNEGTIVQYTRHSFSRYMIKEHPERIAMVRDAVGDQPVITFKSLGDRFNTLGTFGAVEGLDGLGGQNLAVIGTPHLPPLTYLLLASALGLRPSLYDSTMQYRLVRYGGYEFWFETFTDNEGLRDIQLWSIETELVQAVGRARVLRNDCQVTVFSNFPVPGAEFVYLSKQQWEVLGADRRN